MDGVMTGPQHPDARRFEEARLFNDLATFRDLERRIVALPTEAERGKAFEVFAEAYLATQAVIQAEEAWPFAATPLSIRQELHLGDTDLGVDGIVRTRLGELQAYQVKFRTGRPSLTWTELSTFLGLADYVPRRILFTNCDDIADVLEERRGFYCIRGSDLDRLESGDFEALLGWLQQRPVAPPKKTPRPDQCEAIAAICDAYERMTGSLPSWPAARARPWCSFGPQSTCDVAGFSCSSPPLHSSARPCTYGCGRQAGK
jgi:predicted helicase